MDASAHGDRPPGWLPQLQAQAVRLAALLYEADPETGALLLERLEPGTPLADHPDRDGAIDVICALLRRLRRPPPPNHPFPLVRDVSLRWAEKIPAAHARHGRPFPRALVETAATPCTYVRRGTERRAPGEPGCPPGKRSRRRARTVVAHRPEATRGRPAFDAGWLILDLLDDRPSATATRRLAGRVAGGLGVAAAMVCGWVWSALWRARCGNSTSAATREDASRRPPPSPRCFDGSRPGEIRCCQYVLRVRTEMSVPIDGRRPDPEPGQIERGTEARDPRAAGPAPEAPAPHGALSEAEMMAEELIAPVTDMPSVQGDVILNRRTATNALAAIAAEVSGKVATLAYFIAAARTLSKADFGAFAYALSFGLLMATLPSWGFEPLLVQRGSAEPHRLRTLLSETLVWRTAIAVPVFVAAGIAGAVVRPTPRAAAALLVVMAACMFDVFTGTARAAAQALQRQVTMSKILVLQRVAAAVFAVGALAAGLGLVGLSVAYMLGSLIGLAGSFWALRGLNLHVDLRSVRASGMKETGRLSLAIGIDAMVAMALFRIDQVILAALKGDAAVAAYAATYRLLETVLFVTWGLSRAILPVMSASKERWQVKRALEQGVGALAILYVPFGVGLWIEAGPVIGKLYSAGYVASGIPVARWLAGCPLLFAIGFLGTYALLSRGRRWLVLAASAIAAVFNVGLNLAIIPSLSGTGAAIATTASYGLEAAVIIAMLVPLIGVPNFGRVLIVPVAASAAMAAVLLWMHQSVLIEVPIGVVIYGVAWLGLARWWTPGQLRALREVTPRRSRAPAQTLKTGEGSSP